MPLLPFLGPFSGSCSSGRGRPFPVAPVPSVLPPSLQTWPSPTPPGYTALGCCSAPIGSWCLPRPGPISVHAPAASHFRLSLEMGNRPSRRVSQLVLPWPGLCRGDWQLLSAWPLPLERPRFHRALLFPQLHVCCMTGSLFSFLLGPWML